MGGVRVASSICILLAIAGAVSADFQVTVDLLDPSDGGPQPTTGILVIDVMVQTDPADEMIGAGIGAHTLGANQFAYSLDPNTAEPVIASPGSQNPFVTCVSRPLPRLGNARFNNANVVVEGSYCPDQFGPPDTTPTDFAVIFLNTNFAPCGLDLSLDGAIIRIAVNLDPTIACQDASENCFRIYPADCLPSNATPILSAGPCPRSAGTQPGLFVASCDRPRGVSLSFVLAYSDQIVPCDLDFDQSGIVDQADLAIFLNLFARCLGDPGFDPSMDFDANGCIELQDLATVLASFGELCCGLAN